MRGGTDNAFNLGKRSAKGNGPGLRESLTQTGLVANEPGPKRATGPKQVCISTDIGTDIATGVIDMDIDMLPSRRDNAKLEIENEI